MKYPMAAAAIKIYYGQQKTFGEKLGLSELEVSQILHGRKKLSDRDKATWSKYLGTPRRILFGEQTVMSEQGGRENEKA